MSDNATPGTVRLHRVLRAPPSRVYRAFLDPDAMVKWLPPHGFTGKVHAMDARVGGGYTMSFTNFGTGSSREQAATALKHFGIPCVIAASFSETYKRNAFNNGFVVFECPALVAWQPPSGVATHRLRH